MEYDNLFVENQNKRALDFLANLLEFMDDVDAILADVAAHYDADRAYVFEFAEDQKTLDNTYEWCREGIEPQIDHLKNIPFESVTVWVEQFERVGAFYINSLSEDVDNNSLTYELLEMQGITSLIAAPIYKGDRMIGFIGVDDPRINMEDIVALRVASAVLHSEISRKITSKNQMIKDITQEQIKSNAELGEIRDIIASANMGTWRIELVENEPPRMYVDETMRRLLGLEGRKDTPEKVYDEWFYNITSEAVTSVLNSVERMQQGYFDENTYLWKHPSRGVRYVRCGGTAKAIPGGYSLQGYHYDVDEVVRKNQAQTLKLRKALEDKKEYYDTLGALGGIFYSIHVLELATDEVTEFTAKNEVKDIVDYKKGATAMMHQVMEAVVEEPYKENVFAFTDLRTLPERMQNKGFMSIEFVGVHFGWFLASFITMETDEEGKPTKVIFTTRIIDEEKKQCELLINKTQTDEMTGLYNRRAYEEKIYEHNDAPEEDKFIYLSIDANGLKVVNDTKGHAAGDELLIGVAECMKKALGAYGQLYRTGGDEFVAILFCDRQEVERVLKGFDRTVEQWKGKLIDGITISYGWVDKFEMPGASTRELGAVAEQRMYEAKSAFYRKKGVDRRGQQDAHRTLCELYTKILKINITEDSYDVVNMNVLEQTTERGFSDKISEWLTSFGTSGQVHPDDLDEYIKQTDIRHISEYFKSGKTSMHIFYRRKYEDGFKQVMMEIVPANDYSPDNESLFLYVKDIDK